MDDVNEQQCLDCIAKHSGDNHIVGVKIRLGAQIANQGKHEQEAYRSVWHLTISLLFSDSNYVSRQSSLFQVNSSIITVL